MHIVYITHEYPKEGFQHGGIGSVIQFLALNLVKVGIKVTVVGINNEYIDEYQNDNNVDIYRIKKSNWKFAKFYQNSKRLIKKVNQIDEQNRINVVEGSELSFAFFPKKTSYKKVIRMHGGHHFFAKELGKKIAFWRAFQEKVSFFKAEAFIAVSDYVGMKTKDYLNLKYNYTRIFNSVNFTKFHEASNTQVKKDSLLFVGTICEKKGIRQLVQSIAIVKKRFPKVKLNIVGRDWFFLNGNSYTMFLKSFITKDIEDNITIIGEVPHNLIPKIIEETEICIYPSHMEAMPIALLEAMLMGKPVIAGDIGPSKEAIEDNITGLLVDPYSPKKIADKIISLLSDKKKANLIGKSARKATIKRINERDIIKQNINFYNNLIN